MIRTFVDSGVLIAAARSVGPDRERALQLLEDPDRSLLTSPFVQMEVLPKAIFHKKLLERSFYERYLRNAIWYRDVQGLKRSRKRKRLRRAWEQWTLSTWPLHPCLARTNSSPPKSRPNPFTVLRSSRSCISLISPMPNPLAEAEWTHA